MLTLILMLTSSFCLTFADAETVDITILQTSDLHGRIYPHDYATDSSDSDAGFAKIQTLVKEQRAEKENVILMDCGDTLQDNSAELFNDLPVHPMIQAMNEMGYDLWTIGNHEFNFEKSFLDKNIQAFKGTVLSANTYKAGTNERWLDAYKIFDMNGVRVAVVGMLPPNIPLWEASSPSHFEGLEFTSTLEETGKVLKELDGKYDVLIGAYHVGPEGEHGYEGIETIAETYPQFDVIFGGHAHSQYNKEINGVKVVEPGAYGWALAVADIQVVKKDSDYEVASVSVENVGTSDVDADQQILDDFAFVHEESVADANKVVGKITADFIAKPDYITGDDAITTMPTSQVEDTSVIDLINDVQMFYTDADVSSAALFNFGSNLKQGDFKKKDVAFIYKYSNTLVGVNITGENLIKYMEWSASYYNTYKAGDMTISFNPDVRGYNYDMFSGLTYQIDITKEVGDRVKNVQINGKPLDMNKVYKLAVNNYRFGTLMGLDLVTMNDKYYDSYELMQDSGRIRDLIIKYTVEEKNGVLTPSVENNWEIVGVTFNKALQEKVFDLVRAGKVSIPTSEDGRTANVKALNIFDLVQQGLLSMDNYTVKSGDLLWKIAKQHGLTWEGLAEANNLENPN
ncbi:MAG: 5'-nucleotidase C-terminal domain-containing protein, partial [Clostridia bacterium]|nr:5'-nucleotidase C-terminal domain-containing protein [Clostridia bacterium]